MKRPFAPPFRFGAAALLLALAASFAGCGSSESSADEERERQYREFLEKRRAKRWVEVPPVEETGATPLPERTHLEVRAHAEPLEAAEGAEGETGGSEPAPPDGATDPDPRATSALESLVSLLSAPETRPDAPPQDGEKPPAAPDRGDADALAASPGGGGSAQKPFSLEFRDLDLEDFIRLVGDRAGLNIVSTEALEGTITLSLHEANLKEALIRVLESFGYTLVERDGIAAVRRLSAPVPELVSRVFVVNSLPVKTLEEAIKGFVSPRGKLVVNTQRNSILVVDAEETVLLIERYVKLLDVREKQVMIEAEIVEAAFNTNDEIGVALELLAMSADDIGAFYVQDLLPINSAFSFGVFSQKEAYRSILEAYAKRRMVNIISSPRVATLNGQAAVIEVIERIPYVDSTSTTTTGGGTIGATTVQQIEFADVGVTLSVTPSIGEDGFVKMNVIPEVKELTDFFQGVPVIDRRRVETNIVVPNEGTLVIGGLLRNNELEQEEKVPILGDIPLLGFLFTRMERRTQKSELLVFVTPRILDVESPQKITDEAKRGVQQRIEENRRAFD
jgi:type II secretory pathway component GspD/PulD (secretin)